MTDIERKAMEMALEALSKVMLTSDKGVACENAKKALRQALAQPEHEPVAGMFNEKLPDQNPPPWVRDYKPKREWVGLMDGELPEGATYEFDRGVRWAEAKLKEKNGG